MDTIPNLTKSAIRRHATAESFQRGQDYYRGGAVGALIRRGDTIQAEVEGSRYEPYRVWITFDQAGITDGECSCPYDWGGWCKHLVATALAILNDPGRVEARPALEDLVDGLNREALQELVLHLAARHPHLAKEIEQEAASLGPALEHAPVTEAATPALRRTMVDPLPLRRQVKAILHSVDHMRHSEAYWEVGSVVNQVRGLLSQVEEFVEAGDGRNALLLLEAITDGYVENWTDLDDSDGDAGGFFGELGETWTDAALVADLSPQERKEWADKLARWQGEIGDYGIDDVFDPAQAAILQGWDYPPLQRVLQGEITQLGAWEGKAPWYADELAAARLRLLERQGRFQEYLYLAEAESQIAPYVTMLARLGQVEEAVDEGLQYLSTPDDILALAQVLRERGELDAALRVAEHGLTLEGHKGTLATWLCDLAVGVGRPELALQAAQAAFYAAPGLEAYLRVRELAGGRWAELQRALLAHLRQASYHTQARVDVFLHEGLLDDAIAAADQGGGYTQIEQVMDAVLEHRPDWVIRAALGQADRIIEPGQARYYHHAVGWLGRARDAYRAAGREAEWQAYLRDLRERHGRKYKLMGLLDGL
jgi:uncharacterized Zn finger protein